VIEQKLATGGYVVNKRFAVSRKNTRDFLCDLGSNAIGFINCIDDKEESAVVNAESEVLVLIVDDVHNVFGGNNGNALMAQNMPAVRAHHLARLRPRHVSTQIQRERKSLLTSFSEAEMRRSRRSIKIWCWRIRKSKP
jgi:hypothetical protein